MPQTEKGTVVSLCQCMRSTDI